jgi:putative mRNA 3-end processing factor
MTHGIKARPLHMLGYGDEGEAEEAPATADAGETA